MEEIVSVSENNEITGLRNFHRLLFGFRLQTPPPVNHPGTATTTEKFEFADICKQWQFSMMRYKRSALLFVNNQRKLSVLWSLGVPIIK